GEGARLGALGRDERLIGMPGVELQPRQALVRGRAPRGERITELEDNASLLAFKLLDRRRIIAARRGGSTLGLGNVTVELEGAHDQGRRVLRAGKAPGGTS